LKTQGSTSSYLNSIAALATLLISKKLKEENEGVEKEFKLTIFFQSRITGRQLSLSESESTFRNSHFASFVLKVEVYILIVLLRECVCQRRTTLLLKSFYVSGKKYSTLLLET